MTPSQKLLAKCAFDNSLTWDEEDALDELDRACRRGEYLENARLYPTIESLLKMNGELVVAIQGAKPYIDELIEAATWSPPPLGLKVITSLVPLNSALTANQAKMREALKAVRHDCVGHKGNGEVLPKIDEALKEEEK